MLGTLVPPGRVVVHAVAQSRPTNIHPATAAPVAALVPDVVHHPANSATPAPVGFDEFVNTGAGSGPRCRLRTRLRPRWLRLQLRLRLLYDISKLAHLGHQLRGKSAPED